MVCTTASAIKCGGSKHMRQTAAFVKTPGSLLHHVCYASFAWNRRRLRPSLSLKSQASAAARR